MFNKNKKIKYVPDEELLLYNKAKKETTNTDSLDSKNELETAEPIEEILVNEACVKENINETPVVTENGSFDKIKKFIIKIIPSKCDDKKTLIIKMVSIICAVALIASSVYLVTYFVDLGQQDAKILNIRNNYELNKDDYSKNDDNQFSKFDLLKSQNPDVVGWINIAGTEVDNPVYQTDNNDYYVKHDMDKKSNSYGALFLDYRCDINPMSLSRNQIIYGHNMRYGAMFGTLDEYRDINYFRKNPIISFDSLYEKRSYKIFAIMIVNDSEDKTFGYTYSAYRTAFTNDTDFMQWIKYSQDRSLYDIPVDINADDEIITLSTCCYDFTNARFVILGRLVREGENPNVDVNNASVNADVLYPKEYYDKKKYPIPQITSPDSITSNKETTSSK